MWCCVDQLKPPWPRESNQREGHPTAPPSRHPAFRVRARWPRSTIARPATAPALLYLGHPCPRHVQTSPERHPVAHPSGYSVHRSPAQRGPTEERALPARRSQSQIQSQSQSQSRCLWAALLCSSASARRERASFPRGPSAPVIGGREQHAVWPHGCGQSAIAHGCAPADQRAPSTHLEGRMPGRRRCGVAFSLVSFLLATSRESNSLA